MALLQNVIQRGTHASRPAAGSQGVLFFETDTGQLFRDSGSSWQLDDTTLLYTAKGQLLCASASATVGALAAGTDGYVLTADSAQTLGIKWAAVSTASLTTASAALSSDVALTNANQYYDGPSISLAAGTWLVIAACTCLKAQTNFTAKVWDGTTVYASQEAIQAYNGAYPVGLTIPAVITLGSTTTIKVSVASGNAAATLKAACPDNGAGNNATSIVGVKVA